MGRSKGVTEGNGYRVVICPSQVRANTALPPFQALAAVPQLADGLSALGRKSAENLHSVCDMCVANLVQLEDPGAGPELAAQLAGRPP